MDIKTYKIPLILLFITLSFVFVVRIVWGHSFVLDESPKEKSLQLTLPSETKMNFDSMVEKNFSLNLNISILNNQDGINQILSTEVKTQEISEFAKEKEHPIFVENPINFSELNIYLLKVIYYLGLVLLVGWVIWWRIIQNYSDEIKKRYLFWGMILQIVHLIGLISVILIQLNIFPTHELSFTPHFPLYMFLWCVSLFISLIGFLFLFKNQWIDIFWVAIIVFSKSLNGHPLEFKPVVLLVISDSIHLIAASIWAAGLTYIIIFWHKQKLFVRTFLPIFSEYAFSSIVALTFTGSYITYKYVPTWELFFSVWGLFLLMKLFLVSLVVLSGAIIQSKMKKSNVLDLGKWLKIDFLLMLCIILVVSFLTYLSPLP